MLGADALAIVPPSGELAAGTGSRSSSCESAGVASLRSEVDEVEVRLFAILRERAGASDSLEVELDDGATVGRRARALAARARPAELLERLPVRMAVNRDYADEETALRAGDELALVPPVSGGAAGRTPGSPRSRSRSDALAAPVGRPGAGAIVAFQGTTREVERLEYEAYAEMAEERIAAILRECVERHGLEAAAAEHRVGSVPLGEPSVIVAVSAAHREEAFAGAREAIDRIKAEAPIWKREVEGRRKRGRAGSRGTDPDERARLTHLDDAGQRPDGRRRRQAGERAPRASPRRGCGCRRRRRRRSSAATRPKGDVLGHRAARRHPGAPSGPGS